MKLETMNKLIKLQKQLSNKIKLFSWIHQRKRKPHQFIISTNDISDIKITQETFIIIIINKQKVKSNHNKQKRKTFWNKSCK